MENSALISCTHTPSSAWSRGPETGFEEVGRIGTKEVSFSTLTPGCSRPVNALILISPPALRLPLSGCPSGGLNRFREAVNIGDRSEGRPHWQ
jgi:hypothetical protein